MQFARSQIWGRSARLCLNAVTDHAYQSKSRVLSQHLISCLNTFKGCLISSCPRVVSLEWDHPVFAFTDASFQPESVEWPCGLGGVLVDSNGKQVSAFSFALTHSHLVALGYPEKQTVIFEAELFTVLLALSIWSDEISNRPVVVYIDNNSTRDVCISGSARTWPASGMIAALLGIEDALSCLAWFSRVPSESNLSDGPSTNDLSSISCPIIPRPVVESKVNQLIAAVFGQDGGVFKEPLK